MNVFDNQLLAVLGKDIMDNPDNYMIDPGGKLFAKCGKCDAWHGIQSFKIFEDNTGL